jgi:hypothetical protein
MLSGHTTALGGGPERSTHSTHVISTSRKSSPIHRLKAPTTCTHNMLPLHFLIEIKKCYSGLYLEQTTAEADFDKVIVYCAHAMSRGLYN